MCYTEKFHQYFEVQLFLTLNQDNYEFPRDKLNKKNIDKNWAKAIKCAIMSAKESANGGGYLDLSGN